MQLRRPACAIRFNLTGKSNSRDADIYVRRNGRPTISNYDDASLGMDSDEHITISSPARGRYNILVTGNPSFIRVTLTVEVLPFYEQNAVAKKEASSLTLIEDFEEVDEKREEEKKDFEEEKLRQQLQDVLDKYKFN